MKDEANRLGSEFGYSTIDFRKKAQHKRTTEEIHIIMKGGHVVERRFTGSNRGSETKFVHAGRIYISPCIIRQYRSHEAKRSIPIFTPKRRKLSEALNSGENYTKSEVLNVIETNRNRNNGDAAYGITGEERRAQGTNGQRTTERSVGDIEREMQKLDRAAEYAHRGLDLSGGESEREQRLLPKQDTGNRTKRQ